MLTLVNRSMRATERTMEVSHNDRMTVAKKGPEWTG